MSKRELRFVNLPLEDELEIRESENGDNIISGYTAVYNQETIIGGGSFGFREVIRPGFFDRALKEKQDVRALFNHDPNFVLGRTKANTLTLRDDDKGLFVEVKIPDTQVGRDVLTSVRRGDVSGMSFAFTVKESKWTQVSEKDALDLRELIEIDNLFDVGPVVYPAYSQTTAQARNYRSAEEIRNAEIKSSIPSEGFKISIPEITIPVSFFTQWVKEKKESKTLREVERELIILELEDN